MISKKKQSQTNRNIKKARFIHMFDMIRHLRFLINQVYDTLINPLI